MKMSFLSASYDDQNLYGVHVTTIEECATSYRRLWDKCETTVARKWSESWRSDVMKSQLVKFS